MLHFALLLQYRVYYSGPSRRQQNSHTFKGWGAWLHQLHCCGLQPQLTDVKELFHISLFNGGNNNAEESAINNKTSRAAAVADGAEVGLGCVVVGHLLSGLLLLRVGQGSTGWVYCSLSRLLQYSSGCDGKGSLSLKCLRQFTLAVFEKCLCSPLTTVSDWLTAGYPQ